MTNCKDIHSRYVLRAMEDHCLNGDAYDSAWNSCYVQCVGHGADSLTFQCDEIPTAAIEVYVSIQPVSFAS